MAALLNPAPSVRQLVTFHAERARAYEALASRVGSAELRTIADAARRTARALERGETDEASRLWDAQIRLLRRTVGGSVGAAVATFAEPLRHIIEEDLASFGDPR